jgi:hypothetical protein
LVDVELYVKALKCLILNVIRHWSLIFFFYTKNKTKQNITKNNLNLESSVVNKVRRDILDLVDIRQNGDLPRQEKEVYLWRRRLPKEECCCIFFFFCDTHSHRSEIMCQVNPLVAKMSVHQTRLFLFSLQKHTWTD